MVNNSRIDFFALVPYVMYALEPAFVAESAFFAEVWIGFCAFSCNDLRKPDS